MKKYDLKQLGWNESFQEWFNPYQKEGYAAGRVALEHKESYQIYTVEGLIPAEISGKLRYRAERREEYPAVGDWVVIQELATEKKAIIHHIFPRKSKFSRKTYHNPS